MPPHIAILAAGSAGAAFAAAVIVGGLVVCKVLGLVLAAVLLALGIL